MSSADTVTYTVTFVAPPTGTLVNTAAVASPTNDPVAANNTSGVTTLVSEQSDLDADGALNTWGYVNAVPGALSGIAGLVCVATGTNNSNSGALDRMNTVGPCSALDGTSVF